MMLGKVHFADLILELKMIINRKVAAGLGLCTLLAFPLSMAMTAPSLAASAVSLFDPDKDGTVDLNEAKAAASAAFDKLDKDTDATVDAKEAKGHVSKSEFAAGDPDGDKTLTKDEYLAIVESLFKAADKDGDGTLSAKELKSKSGKALVKLLK